MARTPYSDPDAEAAYQDMTENTSRPSFDQEFNDANKTNMENYTPARAKGLADVGNFKRHEGAFPPGAKK